MHTFTVHYPYYSTVIKKRLYPGYVLKTMRINAVVMLFTGTVNRTYRVDIYFD